MPISREKDIKRSFSATPVKKDKKSKPALSPRSPEKNEAQTSPNVRRASVLTTPVVINELNSGVPKPDKETGSGKAAAGLALIAILGAGGLYAVSERSAENNNKTIVKEVIVEENPATAQSTPSQQLQNLGVQSVTMPEDTLLGPNNPEKDGCVVVDSQRVPEFAQYPDCGEPEF